jgi:hypothetical protein
MPTGTGLRLTCVTPGDSPHHPCQWDTRLHGTPSKGHRRLRVGNITRVIGCARSTSPKGRAPQRGGDERWLCLRTARACGLRVLWLEGTTPWASHGWLGACTRMHESPRGARSALGPSMVPGRQPGTRAVLARGVGWFKGVWDLVVVTPRTMRRTGVIARNQACNKRGRAYPGVRYFPSLRRVSCCGRGDTHGAVVGRGLRHQAVTPQPRTRHGWGTRLPLVKGFSA